LLVFLGSGLAISSLDASDEEECWRLVPVLPVVIVLPTFRVGQVVLLSDLMSQVPIKSLLLYERELSKIFSLSGLPSSEGMLVL
jgi:hypothetical protein